MNDKQIERLAWKLKRLETDLDALIYTKVDTVDFCMYSTYDKLASIPQDVQYQSCSLGDTWGKEKEYTWFKGEYIVPKHLDNKRLFLMPGIDGYEGLLFVNGQPYGNYARKITFTAHGNHYCKMIALKAKANEKIDIVIEGYAGHNYIGKNPEDKFMVDNFSYSLKENKICVINENVYDFYYNLKTLNEMWSNVEQNSFTKGRLSNILYDINKVLYYSIDDCDKLEFEKSLNLANNIIKEALYDENHKSSGVGEARIIGHSHMDTAWLWEIDETIKKCCRTFSNQVSMMEQYAEYLFVQSSSYHLELIRRHYPKLFDKLKELIKQKRYEPNGGAWVECDCNITGGESMIRQFLWGQRYTREHFGYTSNTFWLPDTFGYSASIPQIMKGCGIDYFCTTKIEWNDTTEFPYESFYWQGIDGTKVLAHFNKTNLSPAPEHVITYVSGDKVRNIMQRNVNDKRLLSFGYGDGGGGPEPEMLEMARRCKDLEGCPKVSYQLVGDFMEELEHTLVNANTWVGELYLELHRGTLTNQHRIKRNNRKAEINLRNAELISVVKSVRENKESSGEGLKKCVETILVNQFHDILPGTCIPEVHDRTFKEIEEVNLILSDYTKSELCIMPNHGKISLINPLFSTRQDIYTINNIKGFKLDCDAHQQITKDIEDNEVLKVSNLKLKTLESKIFDTIKADKTEEKSPFVYNNDILITPHAKVKFDKDGTIKSFVDIESGRELKNGEYNFNTFIMCEDYPLTWDNWDLDADSEFKYENVSNLINREIISNGEVEFRIRNTYKISDKSTIKQDMIFYNDSKRVDFETLLDWSDKHRFLKVCFDTDIHACFSRQEIQFGHVIRPNSRNTKSEQAMFETLNHKFSDLSESKFGIAILNDCKYGISINGGSMRLSLIKGGTHPDHRGDKGIHKFSYSLLPHDGFNATNVILPAYEFNNPVIVVDGEVGSKELIEVDTDNIIIETVKPCEDKARAYIVRLYESENNHTKTKFSIKHKFKSLELTNMLEEKIQDLGTDDIIELTFKPFEIKTIKINY